MEFPQQKVTAKPSAGTVVGSMGSAGLAPGPAPSIASAKHMVIRAKVSGSARARSQTSISPSVSVNGTPKFRSTTVRSNLTPDAVVRSPSPTKFASRPPSPAKLMRPLSPVKPSPQQPKSINRAPTSMSKAALRPARVDKTSTSLVSVFGDSHASTSSPASLPPRNTDDSSAKVSMTSMSSPRVKAKVTGLTKSISQTVPTILAPPSPPSTSSSTPSPIITTRPRIRTMTTPRRPSIHLPVTVDDSLLIPLPTSPPTSTLSFSSHSSTSMSSVHSYSTNDADTPSTTRSSVLPKNHLINGALVASDEKMTEGLKQSMPLTRTLAARVRADTRISEGTKRTSRHSITSDESMERNESLSDADDTLAHPPKTWRSTSQEREDEERAEAKSNRKIADLEITTKSLLAINASLEAAKARQASEIRELRRKLRQARLALPPSSYRLLSEEDQVLEQNEDDVESTDIEEEEKDECFQRITHILDELLTAGRNALAVPAPSFGINSSESMLEKHAENEVLGWNAKTSADDFGKRDWKHGVAIGNRVLSAEEAKKWTEDTEGEQDQDNDTQEDDLSHSNTLEEEEVERQVGVDYPNRDLASTEDNPEGISASIDVPS